MNVKESMKIWAEKVFDNKTIAGSKTNNSKQLKITINYHTLNCIRILLMRLKWHRYIINKRFELVILIYIHSQ